MSGKNISLQDLKNILCPKKSCGSYVGLTILLTFLLTVMLCVLGVWIFFSYWKDSFISTFERTMKQYCSNLPPIDYKYEIITPGDPSIYNYQLASALLEISLAVSSSNCDEVKHLPTPPKFNRQLKIEGIDPSTGKNQMFAYVFWNDLGGERDAVIVFTGTMTLGEWEDDFQVKQVEATSLNGYVKGVKCHGGFYSIYMNVRNKLWNWYDRNKRYFKNLFITGHSLGGALSTICSYDFSPVEDPMMYFQLYHYSFASPRTGNKEFVEIFNQERVPDSMRLYNTEDLVVALPPASFLKNTFEHVGKPFHSFTKSLGSLSKDHTKAYIEYLQERTMLDVSSYNDEIPIINE